jgi:hypothetical protein
MKLQLILILSIIFGLTSSYAQVGLEVTGALVETSGGASVEINDNLTETGTGYFKGKIFSTVRTGMTTFAGLTLSSGMDGSIFRLTGSAYAKGNGEPVNFKRYYELNNTGGSAVIANMQIVYVSIGTYDERNGLASPYYIYRYTNPWDFYGTGSASSPVTASNVSIPSGASDWILSDFIDNDNDGIPNVVENPNDDRDGDGVFNHEDYDPTGYFYDEADGKIISGGKIGVTGPGVITIIKDGSDGYYQFFTDGTSGTYTMLVTLPTGYSWSATCLNQGTLDPTGQPNPYVLGNGENGNTGYLTSNACTPFYLTFELEQGDPFVFNNNLPLQKEQPIGIVLSSFTAEVENEGIIITWITETEPNSAGFNIFRSRQENDEYIKTNPSMIPSQGNTTTGASYTYIDKPEQGGVFYYKLEDINLQGESIFYDPVCVSVTSVDIKRYAIPENYFLSQNYPNPFNPETTIEFGLPKAGFVEITIYDINGKLVRTLVSEQRSAGNHIVKWNAKNDLGSRLTCGVYFYRMKVSDSGNGFQQTNRMILIK